MLQLFFHHVRNSSGKSNATQRTGWTASKPPICDVLNANLILNSNICMSKEVLFALFYYIFNGGVGLHATRIHTHTDTLNIKIRMCTHWRAASNSFNRTSINKTKRTYDSKRLCNARNPHIPTECTRPSSIRSKYFSSFNNNKLIGLINWVTL